MWISLVVSFPQESRRSEGAGASSWACFKAHAQTGLSFLSQKLAISTPESHRSATRMKGLRARRWDPDSSARWPPGPPGGVTQLQ